MSSMPLVLWDSDVLTSVEVMFAAMELTMYCLMSERHLSLASLRSSLCAKTEN